MCLFCICIQCLPDVFWLSLFRISHLPVVRTFPRVWRFKILVPCPCPCKMCWMLGIELGQTCRGCATVRNAQVAYPVRFWLSVYPNIWQSCEGMGGHENLESLDTKRSPQPCISMLGCAAMIIGVLAMTGATRTGRSETEDAMLSR